MTVAMKMTRLLVLLLLLSAFSFATPAPSTLIANIPGRTATSLNGAWNIIIDPYEAGLNSRYYRNAKPKDKNDLVEYDFDKSPTLNVPGDWNTQNEQLFFYENPVWYRRVFTYHKQPGARAFVYFGAANYQARVYLNGEKLGEHEGGFTPFNFEATDLLHDGENFLVVEANNARHIEDVPTVNTDWWNYGGITGDVSLVEVPATFIQDYFVQLSRGSRDQFAGWVQLNGVTSPQPVKLEIPEAKIQQTVTTDASGRAEFNFSAKLDLWSPENPKLYDVTLSSGKDKITEQIGFRSIEVQGTKILLNGRPIFLRGISFHDEAPMRGGRVATLEDAKTLLGWAKELHCNFIRLPHYPHNEAEIRLADRMGLLIWSEIPVYWNIDWQNAATLANAESQLRDMIARDHNRASVIMWSLSNETPMKPERTAFLKQLATDARALDSTRLLTSALNRTTPAGPDIRLMDDPIGADLDVLGINEYVGWYEHKPEYADQLQWKVAYDKPVIMSEFGAAALAGRHGDADERWTEEYQANVYQHQLMMAQHIPGLAGLTPWCLADFHSPRRPLPGMQDYYNRKGLISNKGVHKQAFFTLQKFYEEMEAKQ
ncbi:MAG TPA: glycoside hydrolase family 2 TIM barrel-domain containing protein [Terriglobales bacterium]